MGSDFDSWQRGIDRASGRTFAVYCLVLAALQSRPLFWEVPELSTSSDAALNVVALLAVSARGWRGRLSSADAWVLTLLMTLAAMLPATGPANSGTGGDANPAFVLMSAALLAYILTQRDLVIPAFSTLATSAYLATSVLVGGRMLAPALDESVIFLTVQLAIWFIYRQLTSEALRADSAHRRTLHEQSAIARRLAEQDAAIAAQRTLHDRVLTVLIQLKSWAPGQGATEVMRAECRRAAQAVTRLASPLTQSDAVVGGEQLRVHIEAEAADALSITGVTVVTHQGNGVAELRLPQQVADAVSGAVAESLRNVGRHAGVRRADVHISANPESGLLVEVADRGRGFPPGSVSGFGLRQSVSARLREIDGEARIHSSDHGTRVLLSWQPVTPDSASPDLPEPASPRVPELTRISAHPQRIAGQLAAILLFNSLYLAIRYPTAHGPTLFDLGVCLIVVIYLIWCVGVVTRPGALRRAHLVGFLVLPVLLIAGLQAAGNGSLRGFESWIVGLSGIPVVLLALVRPVRSVLALAGLESAVVFSVAVLDPSLATHEVLAPIIQTPMIVALVIGANKAVQHVRASADADERALSAVLRQRTAVEVRQEMLATHHEWLSAEILPFLQAVARAEIDRDDTFVRQRAALLALAVRDELAVPARLPAPVRTQIASARRRGIRVRVRASDEWSPGAGDSDLESLLELMASADNLTDITISLPQAMKPLRVVVSPGLPLPQQRAAVALLGPRLLDIDDDDQVSIITLLPHQPEFA